MLYNSIEYQKKYYPKKSNRSVRRMIISGLIPSNHYWIKGKDYMIYVDDYFSACTEFHAKKRPDIDPLLLSAVLSVKYKVDKKKLCLFLGL